MDLADLRLIEAVAAHGSFSAAAAELRLSQPSVSVRIAALERRVGTKLFQRDNRGARLTAAGQRYLGYVRRSLALLEAGQRAALGEQAPPVMRVGVPASYAAGLAPCLQDAADTCRVGLSLRASHSSELRAAVQDGHLDLALVATGAVPIGLTARHAVTTTIVAVATVQDRGRSGATRYAVHSWDEASEEIVSHLLGHGVSRTDISVVSPAATAISLALNRGHVGVLPRLAAEPDIAAGRLQPVDLPLPSLTAGLDWIHRSESLPSRVHEFIEGVSLKA